MAAVAALATGSVALSGLSAPVLANEKPGDNRADVSGAAAQAQILADVPAPTAGIVTPTAGIVTPTAGIVTPTAATGQLPAPSGAINAKPVSHTKPVGPTRSGGLGEKVVYLASKQAGKPYVWGAQGPRAFDCSGLVQYVYKQLGRTVPRVTNAQYAASQKISQQAKQPGDLIFFGRPGNIHHVGIYAGNGMMWAAPHSGAVVRLQKIYSANYLVGRLG